MKSVSFSFLLVALGHALTFYSVVEFATLTLDPQTQKPKAKIYRPAEVDALLAKHGLGKKDEKDAEMQT